MPAYVWILAVFAVLWVLFVVWVHPFRKGAHAAPRGTEPDVSPDVHALTVPAVTVAGEPPWESDLPGQIEWVDPSSWESDLPGLPEWAADPLADRWAGPGWATGGTHDDVSRPATARAQGDPAVAARSW